MHNSNSSAVITPPDKHSQFLERKAATKTPLIPVIHLTGFTFSEMRASLIAPLDRWEEISREKHLYKPEEIAKAEAQALTALFLQSCCNLITYEGKPELDKALLDLRSLAVVMKVREKDTWEKCYPVKKK
jgi:hypothetical protein